MNFTIRSINYSLFFEYADLNEWQLYIRQSNCYFNLILDDKSQKTVFANTSSLMYYIILQMTLKCSLLILIIGLAHLTAHDVIISSFLIFKNHFISQLSCIKSTLCDIILSMILKRVHYLIMFNVRLCATTFVFLSWWIQSNC